MYQYKNSIIFESYDEALEKYESRKRILIHQCKRCGLYFRPIYKELVYVSIGGLVCCLCEKDVAESDQEYFDNL